MSGNLLPITVPLKTIYEKLHTKVHNDGYFADFRYDISEGGYVSKDNAVVLIDMRAPYQGMLLQLRPDVEPDVIEHWVKYLCDLFEIQR